MFHLNSDISTMPKNSASVSAAATMGRRSTIRNRQLTKIHASAASARWKNSYSIGQPLVSAASRRTAMTAALSSPVPQALDEGGGDQQPVEAPRLRAVAAVVIDALAALEDLLLLGKRGIERQAGELLDHQRQVGPVERVECGRHVARLEVDRIDRVVGREIARVHRNHALADLVIADARFDQIGGQFRLVITVAYDQERF